MGYLDNLDLSGWAHRQLSRADDALHSLNDALAKTHAQTVIETVDAWAVVTVMPATLLLAVPGCSVKVSTGSDDSAPTAGSPQCPTPAGQKSNYGFHLRNNTSQALNVVVSTAKPAADGSIGKGSDPAGYADCVGAFLPTLSQNLSPADLKQSILGKCGSDMNVEVVQIPANSTAPGLFGQETEVPAGGWTGAKGVPADETAGIVTTPVVAPATPHDPDVSSVPFIPASQVIQNNVSTNTPVLTDPQTCTSQQVTLGTPEIDLVEQGPFVNAQLTNPSSN